MESQSAVDIYVPAKIFIQSSPLFINILNRAPFQKSGNLNPKLEAVRMTGKRELVIIRMVLYLVFTVRRIVRKQHLEVALVQALRCLCQITRFLEVVTPVFYTHDGDGTASN